jgi:acyl dehydratase
MQDILFTAEVNSGTGGITMVPLKLSFEDVMEGDESPELTINGITRTMIVRYAGASGDFNPIHHDETFAKEANVPSVFAMGMMNAGFVAHLVQDWLGIENITKYSVKFKERVWPGDSLTCRGKVISKDDASGTIKVELNMVNQHERPTIQATAIARLPKRL